ncbi:MAG: hypothetical protein QGI45_15360 [Myxococcota bacterium]|nr:hypothetical protein [Myxococcota bacterium]
MKKCLQLLAVFLFFAGAMACGKKDPLSSSDTDGVKVPRRPVVLLLESPTPINAGFEEPAIIRVKALWKDDSTPAGGLAISFSIAGQGGGAQIVASQIVSGSDGSAQTQMLTGTNKASFNVVVATPGADDLTIPVVVDGDYLGKLRVRFDYGNLVTLGRIETQVHEGNWDCTTMNFEQLPEFVAQEEVANAASHVIFNELVEQQIYSVSARAYGLAGQEVARGCVIAPAIVGRAEVTVDMDLNLLPAMFEGTYDFGSELHLQEALPGDVGSTISTLDDFFDEPADWLAQQLLEQAAIQSGAANQAGVIAGLDAVACFMDPTSESEDYADWSDGDAGCFDDYLRYKLYQDGPTWLQNTLTVGDDLTDLVTDFTVGGDLEIAEVDAEGNFNGHWQWNDFLFQWRLGSDCDYDDACCARQHYTAEMVLSDGGSESFSPVGADIAGTIRARESDTRLEYDMTVDPTQLNLQYGQLIMFALSNMVLPGLTGENTMAASIETLFGCDESVTPAACGCDRVAQWLGSGFGAIGTAVCDSAIMAIATQLENEILALNYGGTEDDYFMANINAVIADDDHDLQADMLEGSTSGSLYLDGEPASFTGTFRGAVNSVTREDEQVALRGNCEADATCAEYESCQLKINVLDTCQADQVCIQRVGQLSEGANCNSDQQCLSGLCLEGQGCFTACSADEDCGENVSCAMEVVDISLGDLASRTVNACGFNFN